MAGLHTCHQRGVIGPPTQNGEATAHVFQNTVPLVERATGVAATVALFMALDSCGVTRGLAAYCVRCSWAASALSCCMASTGLPQNKHPAADTTAPLPVPTISSNPPEILLFDSSLKSIHGDFQIVLPIVFTVRQNAAANIDLQRHQHEFRCGSVASRCFLCAINRDLSMLTTQGLFSRCSHGAFPAGSRPAGR